MRTNGQQMAGLGTFLKLHIMEKTVRPYVVKVHGFFGKLFPVLGWTRTWWSSWREVTANAHYKEILFGVATAFGYCRGGHLGQCAAHYLMGSAFVR